MGGRDDEGMYDTWGKGAKARKQREAADARRQQKTRPLTETEPRIAKQPNRTAGENEDARTIKEKIRLAVIDRDMGHDDICAMLAREGHTLSRLTTSAVRADTRETLKLIQRIGLLDPDNLAMHRRRRAKRTGPS